MTLLRRLLPVAALMALPVTGYAQEAVLTGTITDSTGGVSACSKVGGGPLKGCAVRAAAPEIVEGVVCDGHA